MTLAHFFPSAQQPSDRNDTHAFIDTQVLRSTQSGYEYNVLLNSRELELDAWDIPVPKDWKTIPVVVARNTPQAAMDFASTLPYFADYEAVDAWVFIDTQRLQDCPF